MIKLFKTADWIKIILDVKKDIIKLLKTILCGSLIILSTLVIVFIFSQYTLISFSVFGILILLLLLYIYIDNKVITFQK